jgi:hypothetical protein
MPVKLNTLVQQKNISMSYPKFQAMLSGWKLCYRLVAFAVTLLLSAVIMPSNCSHFCNVGRDTLYSIVLLEKLIVAQLFRKFPTLHGI